MKNVSKRTIEQCNDLMEFSSFKNLYEMLSRLEARIIPENWKYNNPPTDQRNADNPILENYIHHTFRHLLAEYKAATNEQAKKEIIYHDDKLACFNTGLFTPNYNHIFALFYPNTTTFSAQPYFCYGFIEYSDYRLSGVKTLPQRANYFSDVRELIYDCNLELRINAEHVLQGNLSRFPEDLQKSSMLCTLFLGAIEMAKKRVQTNYKLAVPTYHKGEICLLLPICLLSEEKTDLALAVKREESFYIAKTCLTLDMAYNDARLIAKPSSDWLIP